MRSRRTLAATSDLLAGIGLHSGRDAAIRLCPAPPGAGLVFADLGSGQEIPARPENVVDTSRCTILGHGAVRVQTVEHVLAALSALGIDDARIETSGGEMPAMDGSALPCLLLAQAAGIREHGSRRVEPLVVKVPLAVQGAGGASLAVLPSESFRVTVVLDYPAHAYLGTSAATFGGGAGEFAAQIAPARTYGFLAELDWLKAHGLALGASADNAVALGETGYETPVRFSNELARHKLLDVLGDLALVGRPLQAHVIAFKPGHALNVQMARALCESAL